MKHLIGIAAMICLFSLPAHAQASIGGGALNAGSIHALPTYPLLSNSITYSAGSSDFTPSTFMSYDRALAAGFAALAEHNKTLGEVAKESRERAKTKAKMVVEQDADGNMVVVNPQSDSAASK